MLDPRTVTTIRWNTPCHRRPIPQDCCKCAWSCMNLLDTFELILHFWAVTAVQWLAPSDNLVTSEAKQCESLSSCRNLCLYGNSCEVGSVFESCSLQRFCRIHHTMVGSNKPQEAKLKRFLRQNPQVPYFGGLRNRKNLTATAWHCHSELKHVWKNQLYQSLQQLFLSKIAPLVERLNKLPRLTVRCLCTRDLDWNDWKLSHHYEQSPFTQTCADG